MVEHNKPLNFWLAILLAIAALIIAGGLNKAFVLKEFGSIGGLIVDTLLIVTWVKLWQLTRKPKPDTR